LEEYKLEEIDELKEGQSILEPVSWSNSAFEVPYCPECQENVINTLDPFYPCSVCGFSKSTLSMDDLSAFTGMKVSTPEAFFMDLANVLSEKGVLTLPTHNGIRHFSLLSSNEKSAKGILFCNPTDISDKFLITQGELDALMMIEKPSVRLKAKLMLRSEYALTQPFYPVFFADDTITLALSTALKSKGIDAVFCDHVPTLRVASALDEHVIISTGRDMLPWYTDMRLTHPSFCEYNGFEAYGDANGIQLNTTLDFKNKPYVQYVANHEASSLSGVIRFEPAHAALRSIVIEHALADQALCGVHFSREHPSHLFLFLA